ncbi:hypothetical protein AVEN_43813-1 [Araneus ventricosus]|uniref:Uncharacterized protein n=1 Tax=Araneus ventricosus TaxID=182803 RepID=A0A4Y2LHL7_ARAVE|nr:hypothetical protein AVEN_43813-1 [Araneus ventricosus]
MNQSGRSDRAWKCMKRSPWPKSDFTKRRVIIPTEKYSTVLERLSKNIPAEDKSDALDLDGEVTEYSDYKTDFETDMEGNPVNEEYNDLNSNTNVCIIHPFNL